MRRGSIAAAALLVLGSMAHADNRAVAKLVADLGATDQRRVGAAKKALEALGPAVLEEIRTKAAAQADAGARQRALAVWQGLVDHHARRQLPKDKPGSKKIRWTLAVRSDLLPYLRCYRAQSKHPQAVILDVRGGEELPRITARAIQDRLQNRASSCRARKVAREVARLFVALRNQPYGAGKVGLKVRRRGRAGHRVEATFSRTLPWDEGRSRTEVRRATLSVGRRCRFRLIKERIVSVVYSAKKP